MHVGHGRFAYRCRGTRMSVTLQQLQATVQVAPEVPTAKWFATIDTAQVRRDKGINWQDLSIIQRWKNLLQGSSEGREADLTCWLVPLSDETLQMTVDLGKSSPFCCTWLQSNWSINEISTYWNQSTNPRLPDGGNGLLRFYDACVLGALQPVLTPDQWKMLTAPLTQWLYIDRNGTLANINVPAQEFRHDGKLTLNKTQLKQLRNAGAADNIIFNMQANERLPENIDPFATYQKISAALALLGKHNIAKSQDQYLFSTLTLDWPLAHFATPAVDQALANYKMGETDLIQLVEQHSPEN